MSCSSILAFWLDVGLAFILHNEQMGKAKKEAQELLDRFSIPEHKGKSALI